MRATPLAFSSLALLSAACSDVRRSAGASTMEPVRHDTVTTAELAAMVGVEAFAYEYDGGPIECVLELEQNGTPHAPQTVAHEAPAGRILLWWHRDEPTLHLSVEGRASDSSSSHSVSHSVGKSDLWWGYRGWNGTCRSEPQGSDKEHRLLSIERSEQDGTGNSALRLSVRFR